MAILPIVCYGDSVLAQPAAPVERFDAELRALVADMVQTMYAAPGVGLAAPQVGVSLRLAVIDISVGQEVGSVIVMANPTLVASEGVEIEEEGCLSVPGFSERTQRAAQVEVHGFDAEGKEWTRRADGLLARAFQHEIDHLDGKLYLERLTALRRSLLVRKLRKKIRAGEFPPA